MNLARYTEAHNLCQPDTQGRSHEVASILAISWAEGKSRNVDGTITNPC
jgi:hypothetical protein